ncbi:MAG: hypothetical protein ACOX47_08260 [Bacillota bacterium]|jgi:type II secretory pathway component PulK
MGKENNTNSQTCFNLCNCLNTCNLTDDERKRLLVFLTECLAAVLKVDVKIST